MPSDLTRGAYSGREKKLYLNTGTYATPVWTEIVRARNIQINRGPALGDVEFHGGDETSAIPGYKKFSGSFEYVLRKGTDAVYDALVAARDAGNIAHVRYLDGPVATVGSKGIDAPILLGEGTNTANGGDPVNESFTFTKADAYDSSGDAVPVEDVAITS